MTRGVAAVIGVVAAVGVGGGIKAIGDVRDKRKPAYHLEKSPAERGTVVGKVTATGTLAALVTVQVGSQISGRIQELAADFGSTVKKGQVIAKLDAQLYAAASEQARANRDAARGVLAQARAKMANAEKQYQRERASRGVAADDDQHAGGDEQLAHRRENAECGSGHRT